MRYFAYLLGAAFALYAGEWLYRTIFRPIDRPTQQMIELAQHFNAAGVKGHIYAVRHGFRHSYVSAASAFQIDGYPLPVSFAQSPTESAAQAHLLAIKASPNLMHPQRNGLLVMDLPMWGDDTTEMAAKVAEVFASFDSSN